MQTLTPASLREFAGRKALERVGVDVSPEFGAALFPRPREKVVTGGWQAGKSVEGAAEIYIDLPLIDPDRDYRYWVIVPTYRAPHKEIDYLLQWCQAMGIVSSHHFPDGSSCRIALFGGRVVVETKTAEDPEGIAGEPCDGVLVVEAGQMPETIRTQAQGRIVTRRGWITYTGTLEDDEAKPRYAWYGTLAERWRDHITHEQGAYELPTWANRTVFPGGRQDPEITRQELIFDEHSFSRRYGGRAKGVRWAVYTQLQAPNARAKYLKPIPAGHDNWVWGLGVGGEDYGSEHGHPSALSALSMNDLGELWVRECHKLQTSDTKRLEEQRLALSHLYSIPRVRWGFDPMLRAHADYVGAEAVDAAAGARMRRAGGVIARLNGLPGMLGPGLFFDINGHGVTDGYDEMTRVHLAKKLMPNRGEVFEYVRIADDVTATIENAVEVADGRQPLPIGNTVKLVGASKAITPARVS